MISKKINAYIEKFAGLDEKKLSDVQFIINTKEEQIKQYNMIITQCIINSDYRGKEKYEKIVEQLRREIDEIEELPIIKIHNKKR